MTEKKEWKKSYQLGVLHNLKPIVGNLLLLLEEEKKITIKKMEDAKKLLEKMRKNR